MADSKDLPQDDFITADPKINVQEIMDAIKKKVKDKIDAGVLTEKEIDEIEHMELLPLPDFLEIPNVYQPHLYPGATNLDKQRLKDSFQQEEPTFEKEVGSGLRGLVKKTLLLIRKIIFPLVRFMTRPVYNELKQISYERYNINARKIHENSLDSRVVQQSKEYIILLHNTINNLISETSKMKIEEQLLKTRIKVLEDKVVFIEQRERVIEKKVFNEEDLNQ